VGWVRNILGSYRVKPSAGAERVSSPGLANRCIPRPALIETHLRILYGTGFEPPHAFLGRYFANLAVTHTPVPGWKQFTRLERLRNVMAYAHYTAPLAGSWIECGVFRGMTALMLAQVRAGQTAGWQGEGLVLVDSFEGLSPAVAEDGVRAKAHVQSGAFKVDYAAVKAVFNAWPGIEWRRGWIPSSLNGLEQRQWSLVHLDVDLYEPTLACIQRIYPNLIPGGVIINDDYGSDLFPGARRAWDEYFGGADLPFVVLPSGQAIFLKNPSEE
jgi:hypothetical protein